jgi:3-oxoacyl-[acyl-carrier protein] reductase
MDYGLKGKVALVTGTASRIGQGKTIALTLAREGCDVICNDITLDIYEHGAEALAADIKSLGRDAIAVAADVAISSQVNEMVKIALQHFGRIDILVNNAGGESRTANLSDEERFDRIIAVNLKGAANCINAVLPGMMEHKYGKICSTSSHAGIIGPPAMPYQSGYGVAKFALHALTRSIALKAGPSGVNVNAIIPGWVLTNLTLKDIPNPLAFYNVMSMNEIPKDEPVQKMAETMANKMPSRRINTVQDIANLVAFLVSDVSHQIMGQVIYIDGGMHMA